MSQAQERLIGRLLAERNTDTVGASLLALANEVINGVRYESDAVLSQLINTLKALPKYEVNE